MGHLKLSIQYSTVLNYLSEIFLNIHELYCMKICGNSWKSDITNPAVTRSNTWLIRMHCFLWKLLHVESSHPRQDKSPYPTHNWNDDSDNNFTKSINVLVRESHPTCFAFAWDRGCSVHCIRKILHHKKKQESSKCQLIDFAHID